jgi:hypothetical protein
MAKVRMINSVGDFIAGEEADLDEQVADVFILKGYAEGTLSRDYDEAERAEILEGHQGVSV